MNPLGVTIDLCSGCTDSGKYRLSVYVCVDWKESAESSISRTTCNNWLHLDIEIAH